MDDAFGGVKNSGKPLLIEGGLEWQEMSLSPKDMDFIEAKNSAARDIALAIGVPPQLLGIPGDNTYSNMQEARLALWEETIIPLLDHLTDSLNHWLVPMYNKNLVLKYDINEISGLSSRREKIWARIQNANFITINEKRQMIGLSPITGGDTL
jgi:HK97 family phage portal protein